MGQSTMNTTTIKTVVRELDYRANDGIEVRLLWNAHTDAVTVRVDDSRHGGSFEFQVAAADAHAAFHHPYVYGNPGDGARAFAA
jgi:hypothetical protein